MGVVDQVQRDAQAALKAGERERAGALRMIAASIKSAAKDGGGDVDEVEVLQRERKRRLESAEAYRDGGREDLAATEEGEAALIEGYLPQQLGDDELAALVDEAIAEAGASSPRDMGQVMSLVMPRVKGRADGKRVSAAVKEKLAS